MPFLLMALNHLENKDSYVSQLFLDFSSAFSTMIPQTLISKLVTLGLRPSLCKQVLVFLTNRPQSVKIHNLTSSAIILNTGPLQMTRQWWDSFPTTTNRSTGGRWITWRASVETTTSTSMWRKLRRW